LEVEPTPPVVFWPLLDARGMDVTTARHRLLPHRARASNQTRYEAVPA
jgi:hypothetical protein